MESFQSIQPSASLAPYVKQYWFIATDNVAIRSQRFIPAGYTGLVFNRGERAYFSTVEGSIFPKSYLFGQSTTHINLSFKSLRSIFVIFQPFGSNVFFDVPTNKLTMQNIDIGLIGDSDLQELEKHLSGTSDNQYCIRQIEQFLLKRLYGIRHEDDLKRINTIIHLINKGETKIDVLAQTVCLGYKQFNRIFSSAVGLNPKNYLRIVRFQKALRFLYLRPQTNLNELAFDHGYYDLSHFIKEFREFTGYLPGEFLSAREPYTESYSLFRSCFLETT